MKLSALRRFALLIFLYVCWLTFKNYQKLGAEPAVTELDRMNAMLAGLTSHISPNSKIAFKTNTPAGRHGVLYFKSALALAPAVLELESKADTILLLEELSLPAVSKNEYTVITQGENQQLKYTLMRLKK